MLASNYFRIERTGTDDWFDPILDADTELFVDPFLIFNENGGFWKNAHGKLIQYFDRAFLFIAGGNLDPSSLSYQKGLALLIFREPKELCLGYTSKGTSGAGSGSGYAGAIAKAIAEAIQRGLKHPRHFEELGILNEGFSRRTHLEVKKLHNGKFWNGLETQLPSYMKSDEVTDGWFLALKYNDKKPSRKRAQELPGRIAALSLKKRISLKCEIVDAQRKPSASKL